ncbi:hypothetical protein TNCV_4113571 [Trichonephila clavipes]|nr:hypothetical protein TNCV_4113571 [Trichonephila clavipes]
MFDEIEAAILFMRHGSKKRKTAGLFSALDTAMEWYEQQSECCPTQLTAAQENQRPFSEKTEVYNDTAKNN